MGIFLDENGFVPALEEMAGPTMTLVESLGVHAVQLPHAQGQVAMRRLDHEVM